MEAAKIAVAAPIKVMNKLVNVANSKRGLILATKNTPAVTIVAACISADTGVGPSIASGNQVCKPNWADLPIAPMNKRKHKKSKVGKLNERN